MGDRQALSLEARDVVRRPAFARLEALEQRRRAPGADPAPRDLVRVVGPDQPVVRGDDPSRGRIEHVGQLVEGHEAQPVAVRARARVGPRPVAPAPDGQPARRIPADVAVHVRVDEVLRGPGEQLHRLPELVPAPRPLQPGESGELDRVVLQRRPAQRVLPRADRDQRPAPREAHDVVDGPPRGRERPFAHADGLAPRLHALPSLRRAVAVGIARVELLDVEVRAVVVHVRAAPGQAPVAPEDHARAAGEDDAGHVHLGRGEVHGRPDRGHAEGEMRVVGEQRPAGRGVRAGEDPVVAAARRLRHRSARRRRRGQVASDEDPVVREDLREQHGLHVGGKPVVGARPQRFVVPSLREVQREQLADGDAVHRLPPAAARSGADGTRGGERRGAWSARHSRPRCRRRRGRAGRAAAWGRLRRAASPRPSVRISRSASERPRAEGLRQLALRAAAQDVHLPHPVLRGDVTLRAQEVGHGGGLQVGHAQRVAPDGHGRGEAGQAQLPVHLGQGAARQAPIGGHAPPRPAGRGPGAATRSRAARATAVAVAVARGRGWERRSRPRSCRGHPALRRSAEERTSSEPESVRATRDP